MATKGQVALSVGALVFFVSMMLVILYSLPIWTPVVVTIAAAKLASKARK